MSDIRRVKINGHIYQDHSTVEANKEKEKFDKDMDNSAIRASIVEGPKLPGAYATTDIFRTAPSSFPYQFIFLDIRPLSRFDRHLAIEAGWKDGYRRNLKPRSWSAGPTQKGEILAPWMALSKGEKDADKQSVVDDNYNITTVKQK